MKLCLASLAVCAATSLSAQEQDTPLSAIDWLSRSVSTPVSPSVSTGSPDEPPVSGNATAPSVTTTLLDAPSIDAVGLLPASVTGLSRGLWSGTSEQVLIDLVGATQVDTLPALQDILMTVLLAEADPPGGASAHAPLFMARVDKLLDIGALDPAQALIEAAGPTTPDLYRRWFDVSLLTGTEDTACATLETQPGLAPTDQARIFCLARGGDWTAAALTLNTARALGDMTPEDEALLSRFLDPELYEGEPDLEQPSRISPLVFRMREAIGQSLPTASLPRAFAHADLRTTAAWRYQMLAAERLARVGAVDDSVLIGFYTARTPAASGGVWDRAAALQRFDAAMQSGVAAEIAETLPAAWDVMQQIRAEVPFARLYAQDLIASDPEGEAARLTFRIAMLSPSYVQAANTLAPVTATERLWQSIALDDGADLTGNTLTERAVVAGLSQATPPAPFDRLIAEGQSGEAILRALSLFEQGRAGDSAALTDGLAVLRAVGMTDIARQLALQILILDRPA